MLGQHCPQPTLFLSQVVIGTTDSPGWNFFRSWITAWIYLLCNKRRNELAIPSSKQISKILVGFHYSLSIKTFKNVNVYGIYYGTEKHRNKLLRPNTGEQISNICKFHIFDQLRHFLKMAKLTNWWTEENPFTRNRPVGASNQWLI